MFHFLLRSFVSAGDEQLSEDVIYGRNIPVRRCVRSDSWKTDLRYREEEAKGANRSLDVTHSETRAAYHQMCVWVLVCVGCSVC